MNKFLSFTTALCVALSVNADAKIWRVNNNLGVQADFTTPNAAIAAATAGDTIHIEASASAYSSLTLNKRLIVRGPGYFLNETTPNPKTQHLKTSADVSTLTLDLGSRGSIVEGLTITSIYISDSFATVQRCYISFLYLSNTRNIASDTVRNNYIGGGIYVNNSTYKGHNLIFYNNIINGTINITSSATSNFTGYFINNNFVHSSGGHECSNFIFQNNIFNAPNFGNYILTNTFVNNIASNGGIPSGNNNQLNVPMAGVYEGWSSATGFSSDGRYKLKTGSPAIGAGILGGTAVDCGAFGGPAPYVLSGMPSMPSIYDVNMPTQVNSGTPAINITVSAAAH